jgi:hypothetical protein
MPSVSTTRPIFATPGYGPIQLPENVLAMIVSLLREVKPATATADARSLYAGAVSRIGSVCKAWRGLVKRVMMADELAWLSVSGTAQAAKCLSSFPYAQFICIRGVNAAEDISVLLRSTSVARLALTNNDALHDLGGLSQLVGLQALYLTECEELQDMAALSSLVGLRTLCISDSLHCLNLSMDKAAKCTPTELAQSLLPMTMLTSLNLSGTLHRSIHRRRSPPTTCACNCSLRADGASRGRAEQCPRGRRKWASRWGGRLVRAANLFEFRFLPVAASLARMTELTSLNLAGTACAVALELYRLHCTTGAQAVSYAGMQFPRVHGCGCMVWARAVPERCSDWGRCACGQLMSTESELVQAIGSEQWAFIAWHGVSLACQR